MLIGASAILAFAFSPLPVLGKDAKPTTLNQLCFYGVYDSLKALDWEHGGSSKVLKPECTNANVTLSIYASSEKLCSQDERTAGFALWKKMCRKKSAPLVDISSYAAIVSESYISNLPLADPELNETATMESPVTLTRSYYNRVYRSWELKLRSTPLNQTFGWVLIGYWGLIVLLGMLSNLYQAFLSGRITSRIDAERGSGSAKFPQPFDLLASARFWVKTHVFIPATIGTHPQRMWNFCTVPKRLEVMAVACWWALCIIIGCVAYYTVPGGNTLSPDVHEYLWNSIAVRTGCLSYACLAWIWMFAQRNNIFIWATGWKFGTFNIFHRHCARASTIFGALHGVAYTVDYAQFKHKYHEDVQDLWLRAGIVALILMCLLVAFSSSWFRTHFYDSFLLIHITLCIVLVAMFFLHSSKFTDGKYNGYLWPIVAIWSFDRLLRLTRLLYCNLRIRFNDKTLQLSSSTVTYDAASNVLRIDVQSSSPNLHLTTGQHYFLYQPLALRGWENHPFSLAAWTSPTSPPPTPPNEPHSTTLTFWARPHTGWTHRLRTLCSASPSSRSTPLLLLEGPYGHPTPLHTYDTILFLAGGTGIAAIAPYIRAHASAPRPRPRMQLVWASPTASFMRRVCGSELRGADVDVELWATGAPDGVAGAAGEKEECEGGGGRVVLRRGRRPDVGQVVERAAERSAAECTSTVVFACGPPGMAGKAREAVREARRKGCRWIEYVEEGFGW